MRRECARFDIFWTAKRGKVLLKAATIRLRREAIKVSNGTFVDEMIIGAPSSTINRYGERDPEILQTTNGKQWHFGIKAHIGMDSKANLINRILASAANVSNERALPHLLDGKEARI